MTFNSHNIVSGQSGPFVLINVCMYVVVGLNKGRNPHRRTSFQPRLSTPKSREL